ncbi:MAG: BtrH N-terminal domain-containing protein [Planctomycetes bacterium]|nr:BtrH N-terminal domain-containing protein [Planctomycetota bacterium]
MDVVLPFEHKQTAHCESGVISGLLTHKELAISEPMAFGISGALTFAYLPLIKFGGMPLIAYRMPPKGVIRPLCKRLGVEMVFETFRDPDQGMRTLDRHLDEGRVVGLQSSVYWLEYFPPDMRFHFNAHNLIVFGRRGGRYLISDPVLERAVECEAEGLKKSRFTRGVLAPKGLLYYPRKIPSAIDYRGAIRDSIKKNTGMMLYTPLPFIGVRGVRMVARKLRKLKRDELKYNRLLIGHMVRMQEEIGTGGAGFRFLYASFLEQAADLLGHAPLAEIGRQLTAAGDEWREFALLAAKMCKGRAEMDYGALGDRLECVADLEERFYRRLRAELPALRAT